MDTQETWNSFGFWPLMSAQVAQVGPGEAQFLLIRLKLARPARASNFGHLWAHTDESVGRSEVYHCQGRLAEEIGQTKCCINRTGCSMGSYRFFSDQPVVSSSTCILTKKPTTCWKRELQSPMVSLSDIQTAHHSWFNSPLFESSRCVTESDLLLC